MVTWKRDPSDSWPCRQQDSSPIDSGTPDHDPHSASDEDLQEAAELAEAAEAALAPGEIEADESPDDTARRLRADQLMVEAILEEGLGEDRHLKLQDELIRYAVPVLRQLLADGRIISKSTKLGRPPSDSVAWLDFTDADREEFALDMVADAEPVFTRAVFETKTWSPDRLGRRASLRTYFVNACVLQFPSLYRKWIRQRRAMPVGLQMDLSGAEVVSDKSGSVDLHDEVARVLRGIRDPKTRELLALRAVGYTVAAAAERVGVTEKAAEGKLARLRRGLRKKPAPRLSTGGGAPATEDGGVQ
jgi:DNA-directed RNA polymerase specialized sigma24 family protein